jgi:hypothetical protein
MKVFNLKENKNGRIEILNVTKEDEISFFDIKASTRFSIAVIKGSDIEKDILQLSKLNKDHKNYYNLFKRLIKRNIKNLNVKISRVTKIQGKD